MSDTKSPSDTLDEALRREAEFRARAIQDFRRLEQLHRTQQEEIDRLNHLVGAKDTYIHQLHLEIETLRKNFLTEQEQRDTYIHRLHAEREALRLAEENARQDVEFYALKLGPVEESLARALTRLRFIESAAVWPLLKFFISLERAVAPQTSAKLDLLPGAGDQYHLQPSPFRLYREDHYTFEGWARAKGGPALQAVRARIGNAVFPAQARSSGDAPEGALGFSIELRIPSGRFWLQFEAQGADGIWRSLLNAPVWREPSVVV